MAKVFIIIGLVLIALGLIWQFAPWLLSWFGNLPGDINIQKGNSRIFIPITSMAVISIVLTIIINLFR
ncbi:DUF2905 domain-containing protein [Methylophaga sp.]|jgi:uncharacterized membrane protein|uniref:DUF2905 domain-containing protein n=1 Tax=Methylophaga sp. TaxID=2024840 RepID=UPI0013FF7B3B|nr:DUF2905 domain-containing protein [Methylophaga sp.]MTI64410.1 DUF2905 domain-containing protein [Methylophaga sp.]